MLVTSVWAWGSLKYLIVGFTKFGCNQLVKSLKIIELSSWFVLFASKRTSVDKVSTLLFKSFFCDFDWPAGAFLGVTPDGFGVDFGLFFLFSSVSVVVIIPAVTPPIKAAEPTIPATIVAFFFFFFLFIRHKFLLF
ncbi:hypothetical protein [Spiroplasma endosymbiont of Polydrusus pterygomalis]|uniref:hypothetical protein n=1 Tax=Spiroplasma endosymbiont of Polydrusus pterygomalis TaxID=3139327 RepID=UPI003CCB6D05